MKLQQRLFGLIFLAIVTCVHAAPDKPNNLDDLVTKVSASSNREAAQSEAAGDLLLQAMSLMGVAYRFGGSTPSSGLDCSGFIQYIFKKSLKINMPRTAAEMARTGRAVSRDELAPGDLVFFNTRGFANSHVGLYMGNGKFIHSPRTGKSVEMGSLSSDYWNKRFNGARRVNRNTMNSAPDPVVTPPKPARVTKVIEPQEKPPVKETVKRKDDVPAAKHSKETSAKGKTDTGKKSTKGKSKSSAKEEKESGTKKKSSGKSSKADETSRSKKKKIARNDDDDDDDKPARSKKSSASHKEKKTKESSSTKKKTAARNSDKKKS